MAQVTNAASVFVSELVCCVSDRAKSSRNSPRKSLKNEKYIEGNQQHTEDFYVNMK